MLNALKNRRLFDRYMQSPPYDTYFEAVFRRGQERVIRVLTDPVSVGFKWVDPITRNLYLDSRSPWNLIIVEPTEASLQAYRQYQDSKNAIVAYIEYLYDLACVQLRHYPVYRDADGHVWYISHGSRYEQGRNWSIELFCPDVKTFMQVEWDHGPLDWLFYHDGAVDNNVRAELWERRVYP